MGITLAIFKLVGNSPVEKDKLHIVPRCLDIWSWIRCKILVGILLSPEELERWRSDVIFKNFSLLAAFVMKEWLFFVNKKLLKDLFEILISTARKTVYAKCWNIMESSKRPSKYYLSVNFLAEKKNILPITEKLKTTS